MDETARGVKVGDSVNKVYEMYGIENVRPNDKTILYEIYTGHSYVMFTIENEKVIALQVGLSLD